ncbi:hypothetical protein [Bacillus sp. REN10]|uniref:hypothetical protein n=1 Tax=Bacillus sp. REN10 TaxID=2782541 RepID=UPI00193B14BD|nr:hypothetical protein [Bacillus sp. REN10]
MFMVFMLLLLLFILIGISYRYWPVSVEKIQLDEAKPYPIIDVRDYQEANQVPLQEAIQMPCGYIPRYAPNLNEKVVYIAAGNTVECNFAVRLLKRFGIEVKGCICMKSSC